MPVNTSRSQKAVNQAFEHPLTFTPLKVCIKELFGLITFQKVIHESEGLRRLFIIAWLSGCELGIEQSLGKYLEHMLTLFCKTQIHLFNPHLLEQFPVLIHTENSNQTLFTNGYKTN